MNEFRYYDIVVIGGGPAGIAAATCAAENGASTALVDDNPRLGGQIWRSANGGDIPRPARRWLDRFMASGCKVFCGMRIVDRPNPKLLLAESEEGTQVLPFSKLILATGARERLLPFSGWTLPNVFAAGGLQALVKGGAPIDGKRVAVAGTGPLLLAVASYLKERGAEIVCIAEQAPWTRLTGFGAGLWSSPAKLAQAVAMGSTLRGVKFRTNCWPVEARGDGILREVEFQSPKGRFRVACDFLACGFGLVPNLELPRLLDCRVANGFVAVDEWQRTSVEDTYCVGEPTGIGGVDSAVAEGQIAGLVAAGRQQQARSFFRTRARAKRFEERLSSTFALRPELRRLCDPGTLVCRCEDVNFGRLQEMTAWREAKLQTRCGMGACQGRTCGAAAEFLFGWEAIHTRPPVYPARVGTLAEEVVASKM
jgi:NADPH-dependent 2,4-dienoyl-CoA reductase/sulfur reductase-like enzyme